MNLFLSLNMSTILALLSNALLLPRAIVLRAFVTARFCLSGFVGAVLSCALLSGHPYKHIKFQLEKVIFANSKKMNCKVSIVHLSHNFHIDVEFWERNDFRHQLRSSAQQKTENDCNDALEPCHKQRGIQLQRR